MGPYCKFCDNRCFVERVLKDGQPMLMATCPRGMEHSRDVFGEDASTAINPAAAAVVARINARYEDANLAPADLGWDHRNGWTIDGMVPDQWAEAMYGEPEPREGEPVGDGSVWCTTTEERLMPVDGWCPCGAGDHQPYVWEFADLEALSTIEAMKG